MHSLTLLQGILLGAIQGLTEFLPVSSSGHLVLAQNVLGITEPPIFFDVLVHAATLISVIAFFFKDLLSIKRNTLIALVIATIPAGLVGLLLEPHLEAIFTSTVIVGVGLILTAILLFLSHLLPRSHQAVEKDNIKPVQALLIGVFQSLAILPGISRSGSTVSASLFAGLTRKSAFSFSFLVSIPAILGALLLQLSEIPPLSPTDLPAYLVGFFTAAFAGFLALKLLEIVINKAKLHYFGIYTFILGTAVLALTLI